MPQSRAKASSPTDIKLPYCLWRSTTLLIPPFQPSMASSGCGGILALYALNLDLQHETQRLISTIVSTSLFGISTSLALASTYIIIGKGVHIRAYQLLLAATIVLYASTTIAWVANVHGSLTYTRQATLAGQAVAACDAQTLLNPMQPSRVYDRMMCIQTATLTINIVIGDSIVWWRALMLWAGRSRYVVFTLGLVLILSTFAMSTADTTQACHLDLVRREAGYGQLFSGTKIGAAASILSLVTNVTATLLTAYKAWTHARLLKTYFTEGTAMTNVERILILLTESGLTYSTIWLLVTIYQIGINMGDAYDTATFGDSYWGVVGYFVNGGLVGTIVGGFPTFPSCPNILSPN
ncbi:hypothetical protein C8Q74DRAFT_132964 [Fomes fomentarius]|nr:hypothetical protein C8Q74DRAFT_132964 [Fomes fomentarius]